MWKGSFSICIFILERGRSEVMNEGPTRHSTRTKKTPKFREMMDTKYGAYGEVKANDQKEPLTSAQENNQLAKLLMRFINSSNQKSRDIQSTLQQPSSAQQPPPPQERSRNTNSRQPDSKTVSGPSDGLTSALKGQRQIERGGAETTRGGSKVTGKKGESTKKGGANLPSAIESDMSYHAMLGQHIRSNLADPKNLSAQTLMQLGLPSREALEQGRGKEGDKKKRGSGVDKGGQSRQQLKPFKRQSYHVAIAYHIYLKGIKSGPNPDPRDIDPTYNARRLREQNQRPQ